VTGLLGSNILEVAIGVAFIYLLLAIFCTNLNEWFAGLLNTRAKMLEQAIRQLLGNQQTVQAADFLKEFYRHPVIKGLMRDSAYPSYIPARAFAAAVIDLTTPQVQGVLNFADLDTGIKKLPDGDLKRSLLALIQNADGNLNRAATNLEAWFDDAMDRASGWYKRRTQVWTIVVASCLTIAANADTLNVARRLWTDPAVRNVVIEDAKIKATQPKPENEQSITEVEREQLGSVLGWSEEALKVDAWGWVSRLIGWIFTIIAVSLGAPFWFDILNKIMNLRNAGKSPNEAPKAPEKAKRPPQDQTA
jgi:hypothetical protein